MEKEFEYKEEYAWLTNICLNVTDACNLACRYCFVEQHPHYMTLDVAKQTVHFILDNLEKKNKKYGKNEKASITFFGGEPTLMWDEIIVPLTNYIKENNFPITLGITTNGTLLNQERIKFLKNNKIQPLLSIDGNKFTQEYNRPCLNSNISSFDAVSNNFKDLLENFPNITFRMTIYAPTVEYMFENYLFAISQGFKNVYMIPDARNKWNDEQKEIMCRELDKIFKYNELSFENNCFPPSFSTLDKMYKTIFDFVLDSHIGDKPFNRSCNRCGLGTGMGSIGYNGDIFGCQEQTSINGKANYFYIGNINSGIDINKHSIILKDYMTPGQEQCEIIERCDKCCLRKVCYEFNCPSRSYELFQNFLISPEIQCLWNEKIFSNLILLSEKMLQKNNEQFKLYLSGVN